MNESPGLCLRAHTHEQWLALIKQGGCFLLAEAAINDAVRSFAERLNGVELENSCLYWEESGRIHASIAPYLIRVTSENWSLLQENICSKPNWGVAIELEWFMLAFTPAQQLMELMYHLRQWGWVEAEDKSTYYLRLADWQIITPLMQASNADERAAFFGPIATFISISPDKQITMTQTVKQKTTILPRFPQQLSSRQWLALRQIENRQQHHVYIEHLKQHHTETVNWPDTQMEEFIVEQIKQAQMQGFLNRQEIVKYLSMAVIFGANFTRLDWATTVLSTTPQGAHPKMNALYQAALNSLHKDVT